MKSDGGHPVTFFALSMSQRCPSFFIVAATLLASDVFRVAFRYANDYADQDVSSALSAHCGVVPSS
jgi:hypothetical protein